ncbi:MAG: uroporphyrinogen decarboxylase family protein [Spirochaetota bacterium]
MTSRERITLALQHREPDKVPVDCGGMRSTGLMGMTYNQLKRRLGVTGGHTRIYDMVQQLAVPEQWYLDRFSIDAVDLSRAFCEDPADWREWTLPDGSPTQIPAWLDIRKQDGSWVCVDGDGDVLAEMPEGSCFFDQKLWPLYGKHQDSFENLEEHLKKVMWVHMADPLHRHAGEPGFLDLVREKAKRLYEDTDAFIMLGFGGQFFELGQYLYRNDEFMMNLVSERPEMEKLLDRMLEIHLAALEPLLDAVAPYVQLVVMGDDLGMQSGPLISPKMYREMIKPRASQLYRLVKQKTDLFVFLHTCGAVAEFIPDIIDAGVDVINPVQTSARGMDPAYLKREFGRDLSFWGGGVDTQNTMLHGTPGQVREEVRRNGELFMKGGGFVFNQVHNLLYGVPPENILAMYEAAGGLRYDS